MEQTLYWKLNKPAEGCQDNWPAVLVSDLNKIDFLLWALYGKNYFYVSHNGSGKKNGSSPEDALPLADVFGLSDSTLQSLANFGDTVVFLIDDGQPYDFTSSPSGNFLHRLGQLTSSFSLIGYNGKPTIKISHPLAVRGSRLLLQNLNIEATDDCKGVVNSTSSDVAIINCTLKGAVSWVACLVNMQASNLFVKDCTFVIKKHYPDDRPANMVVCPGMGYIVGVSSSIQLQGSNTFIRLEDLPVYYFNYSYSTVRRISIGCCAFYIVVTRSYKFGPVLFGDLRSWSHSTMVIDASLDFSNSRSQLHFDVQTKSSLDADLHGSSCSACCFGSFGYSLASISNFDMSFTTIEENPYGALDCQQSQLRFNNANFAATSYPYDISQQGFLSAFNSHFGSSTFNVLSNSAFMAYNCSGESVEVKLVGRSKFLTNNSTGFSVSKSASSFVAEVAYE